MVRVEAAFAIWRIDPKEIPIAMPVLVKEIDSTVSLSANTAMIHLGSIGPAAVDAIPGLTNVLKRAESCYQRVLAAAALAEIDRPNCKLTIPVLREGLKDKQATQMAAAAALRRMGPAAREAVPDLKALLLSDDEVARDAASRALKAIEPPR
jgi:HEAT repeat protein